MIAISTLWLPILVSAVFVFLASTVLWMSSFWHGRDYAAFDNDDAVVDALSKASSGQYMVPKKMMGKCSPEEREAAMRGPWALVMMRNPASAFSFPGALASYFIYTLVISILVAYIAGVTLRPGAHYLRVFRVVGTAGILAYSFNTVSESIWYGKPWRVTIRTMIDGVIYGLLMAGVFGWLWPEA